MVYGKSDIPNILPTVWWGWHCEILQAK